MKQATYASIEKLIRQQTQHGNTLHVVFLCPVTGAAISGYAAILPEQHDTQTLDDIMLNIRCMVMSAVRETLCSPNRVVVPTLPEQQTYSLEALKLAAATAFQSVQHHFVWNIAEERWVSNKAATEFETDFVRQLATSPITDQYDCTVLAQLLIEIANADGNIAPEERLFLEMFLRNDETVVITGISPEALADTRQQETVLMLCWALALCDQNLHQLEASCLQKVATGLNLSDQRVIEIQEYAKRYIVDQALQSQLTGDPSLSAAAIDTARRVAKAIGLEKDEQVIHDCLKRNQIDE